MFMLALSFSNSKSHDAPLQREHRRSPLGRRVTTGGVIAPPQSGELEGNASRYRASRMRAVPPLNDGPANSSRDLVAGLRAHIWTILLTAAVVTAIVVAMSLRQTPQYTAAASVVLQDSGDTASTPNMATEKQVASSDTVANQVIGSLHLRETPDEVASGLSISVPVDT